MPRTRRFEDLGPGALETIWVSIWRQMDGAHKESDYTPYKVKVVGRYTIYCGAGWTHQVEIDARADAQRRAEPSQYALTVRAYHEHDTEAAGQLALEVIGTALDDWSDPCEDSTGDEEL